MLASQDGSSRRVSCAYNWIAGSLEAESQLLIVKVDRRDEVRLNLEKNLVEPFQPRLTEAIFIPFPSDGQNY
jgi:hypothetical protein